MNRVKIVCPTNDAQEVEDLIKAGAGELYFGYVSTSWARKLSHIASSNRRYYPESSFHSMKDVAEAVAIAKKHNVPVSFAINGSYYLKSQYPELLSQIKQAADAGIDAVILSDIPLMIKVREKFPKLGLIASTCTSSFNSESVKFYQSLGAKRVILPRHLTLEEIRTIRKKVTIELEVLGLFDWCIYDDGLCTYHHGMEKLLGVDHGCLLVNHFELVGSEENAKEGNIKRIVDQRIKNFQWDHFCAACLVREFSDMGINSFKIAGRRFPTAVKVQSLKFIHDSFAADDHDQLYFNTFQRRHPLNANAYE